MKNRSHLDALSRLYESHAAEAGSEASQEMAATLRDADSYTWTRQDMTDLDYVARWLGGADDLDDSEKAAILAAREEVHGL